MKSRRARIFCGLTFLCLLGFGTTGCGRRQPVSGNHSPEVEAKSEAYERAKVQQDAMLRENARMEKEASRNNSLDR